MTALARHADPVTAHEAATKVGKGSRELEDRIGQVVAAGRHPVTAESIAEMIIIEVGGPCRWTHSTIVTAVTRARRRKLIVKAGTGTTSRGSRATAYVAGPA